MGVKYYFASDLHLTSGCDTESRRQHAASKPFSPVNDQCLIRYAYRELRKEHYDYFIFGHRHLPLQIQLSRHSYYINTGDWLHHYTYAVFDGTEVTLQKFPS